jgi:hypothetical protein
MTKITIEDFEQNYELLDVPWNTAGRYYINPDTGFICNKNSMKRLGTLNVKNGYYMCTLKLFDEQYQSFYNHSLNFMHFHHVPFIKAGFEIDHADQNSTNNNIKNLRLGSLQNNRKNRTFKTRGINLNYGRRVRAINLDKNTKPKIFNSMSECAKFYNFCPGIVSLILNKKKYYTSALCSRDDCHYTFVYMNDSKSIFKEEENSDNEDLIEINEYTYDLFNNEDDDSESD